MARYSIREIIDASIIEDIAGRNDDLSENGGDNGVGRARLAFSAPIFGTAGVAADIVAQTRYGEDVDGETGPILLSVDYDVSNTIAPATVRLSAIVALAPITSQAPVDQEIPILVDLQLDKDVSTLLNATLLTTYTVQYRPEEGGGPGFGGLSAEASAEISQTSDPITTQRPVSLAEHLVELETRIDRIIDPDDNFATPFDYAARYTVEAPAPVLRIDPDFIVVVDGVSVPADQVYVLAAPENLGFYGDFPDEIPEALDGFLFDPGNILDLRDRTVSVRGTDEDGLEAGWGIGEIRDVVFEVPNGASVIQTQSRPLNGLDLRIPSTIFDDGQPLIAVAGDGVTVRNEGRVEGRQQFGVGVLLVRDENEGANAVENTGDIVTSGFLAPGVLIGGDGARLQNDGLIETSGRESYGAWVLGDGIDVRNDGDIRTTGLNALGLKIGNIGAAASVYAAIQPSLIALETLVADELDEEDRPLFFAPTTGDVVNAGLIETTASVAPAATEAGVQAQPALLVAMDGETVVNDGTLRAEGLTAVLLGDDLTFRNTGRVETGEAAEAATGVLAAAVLADGFGFMTIENTGVIENDVVYAALQGALANDGDIEGVLSVGVAGLILDQPPAGRFDLTLGEGSTLGETAARRHVVSLISESEALRPDAPGEFVLQADGEIVGGLTVIAGEQTIRIGRDGAITAGSGAALDVVGAVTATVDGTVGGTGIGLRVNPGQIFGDDAMSSLSLTIGQTGSISGGQTAAIAAVVMGPVDIDVRGSVLGLGGADAIRTGVNNDSVTLSGAVNGSINLFDGADTLVWRDGAALTNGVAIGGDGTDEIVAEGGSLDGPLFQQFEILRVAGLVRVDGVLNVDSATVEDGATLTLDGVIAGDLVVADGGALQGEGVVRGDLSAGDLATVAPGFSPGLLRVEGDAAISGRLLLEVGPDGSDRIEATGALDLTGATIEITVAEDFDLADAPPLLSGASVTGLDAAAVAFSGPGAGDLTLALTDDGVTVASARDNRPPVAVDDGGAGFETTADVAFDTGNVLANDFDLDLGDQVAFFDFDASGALGIVSYNGDGTFRYDPNGAFDGLAAGETATDSFTYRATDGKDAVTATVTVTVTGVAETVNVIEGAPDQPRIEGTDGADRILIGPSRATQIFGGAEADVFVFGRTADDGVRDVAYLRDFEQGLDLIELGGAAYSLRTLGGSSVITLATPDRDTLFVTGVTLTEADIVAGLGDDLFV